MARVLHFRSCMDAKTVATKLTTRVVRRRLARALPVLGVAFAALHAGQKIRRKGWLRGGADAALDVTPYVGRAKALYELFYGDIIAPSAKA
ncbi:MAG: hypothetical protein ACE37F_32505 [Nannocystaceae bacterium]|nr:hypothetical protein [bacterium]